MEKNKGRGRRIIQLQPCRSQVERTVVTKRMTLFYVYECFVFIYVYASHAWLVPVDFRRGDWIP